MQGPVNSSKNEKEGICSRACGQMLSMYEIVYVGTKDYKQ